jgi:hypothetical protein
MEGFGGKEFGQERVLGTHIVYQGEVEVSEGNFDPMVAVVFFG